jgi:hypothetical protein
MFKFYNFICYEFCQKIFQPGLPFPFKKILIANVCISGFLQWLRENFDAEPALAPSSLSTHKKNQDEILKMNES